LNFPKLKFFIQINNFPQKKKQNKNESNCKQVHKIEKHHHRKTKTQNSNLKANLQLKTLKLHKNQRQKDEN